MKIAVKITMFFLLLLIILTFFLYLSRSRPVIFALFEGNESISSSLVITLFNPFRDKEPEIAAKQALDQISKGKCEEVLNSCLPHYEDATKKEICLNEVKYPIIKAKLVTIKIKGSNQRLTFSVLRKGYKWWQPVYVTVSKTSGYWTIVSYDAIY